MTMIGAEAVIAAARQRLAQGAAALPLDLAEV
jgi:hypothetical protein